jgi:sec-independent protein translocase protein TatC
MARLRAASFEDRLPLVEHLGELRTRIVVSISAFAAAFTLCFWQNGRLLDIANAPLPGDRTPITFGVAEPFTTTVTITLYAAIVIALPAILYQAYAYTLPALTDRKSQFNIQIRAKDYYSFFTITLGAMGLIFQLPVGILAVCRLGIVTPKQLARNRRYAYLAIAVVAMVLPGTDPISMLLEMAPLIVLFEASLVLARVVGTPAQANPHTEIATADSTGVTAAN